jgi:hypothetical protein
MRTGDYWGMGLAMSIGSIVGWAFDVSMGMEVPHTIALAFGIIGQSILAKWLNTRES